MCKMFMGDWCSFNFCHLQLQSFTEPSNEKLLPDELPYPYQRPYTVILELNDVLIHTEYDVNWVYAVIPYTSLLTMYHNINAEEYWVEVSEETQGWCSSCESVGSLWDCPFHIRECHGKHTLFFWVFFNTSSLGSLTPSDLIYILWPWSTEEGGSE